MICIFVSKISACMCDLDGLTSDLSIIVSKSSVVTYDLVECGVI